MVDAMEIFLWFVLIIVLVIVLVMWVFLTAHQINHMQWEQWKHGGFFMKVYLFVFTFFFIPAFLAYPLVVMIRDRIRNKITR